MLDLKIFTENIESAALNQVYTLAKLKVFEGAKIRIMPDVHAGKGCVIGFTADLGDKVVPNLVGVDIGCGMRVVNLGKTNIDYAKLDNAIHKYVPSGRNAHTTSESMEWLKNLYCYRYLKNIEWLKESMGTLGGGNHFIEVDIGADGTKYLVIHTGSRNLGKQVAEYYQSVAEDLIFNQKANLAEAEKQLIVTLKAQHKEKEISKALSELNATFRQNNKACVPKEFSYLEGDYRQAYLHDMQICQEFAVMNRNRIATVILATMGWFSRSCFESIHNYIDFKNNIIRKGAISAEKDQQVIIPMNMRDGCILGIGKGNIDWNCSAPHGAGRIMSRAESKAKIKLEDYAETMRGIYTTSVNAGTIDESPMAYKPMQEIVENIRDTVDIVDIIKPVYNFKATE